jgi:MoaA/NifB/PqqE/SkfB family radical SAM enzyme
MLKLQDIATVQVELTTRCNARCPFCMRNYRGSDYNGGYPDVELSLKQFQQIFTTEVINQLIPPMHHNGARFYGVNFNGNLGDFCNAQDGVKIVEWLINRGVHVKINTNGGARSSAWWQKLALPGVEIGFALDGLADTHALHRQDTDWHRVIQNAKSFIQAGGQAVWRFCPFDHNRHQEESCKELAKELGFYRFENIWDGRDRGPVYNRNGTFSHWIGPPGEVVPIKEMLKSHVSWFDKQTIQLPQDVEPMKMICEHLRQKDIYLAADGTVYPCCFLGFYPGKMHHPGNQQLQEIVKGNNALEHGLEQAMTWFDTVEQTWQHSSIQTGRLYACVNHCAKV